MWLTPGDVSVALLDGEPGLLSLPTESASVQMVDDPYTLTIAPDAKGSASGRLYLDPGDGYGYQRGAYEATRGGRG